MTRREIARMVRRMDADRDLDPTDLERLADELDEQGNPARAAVLRDRAAAMRARAQRHALPAAA